MRKRSSPSHSSRKQSVPASVRPSSAAPDPAPSLGPPEVHGQRGELPDGRICIERMMPAVDGGRYPAKRIQGRECRFGADIFSDGHPVLSARLKLRAPGAEEWTSVAMQYAFDPDRWFAAFTPEAIGRWQFQIEAWRNRFGEWQRDLIKRCDAGVETAVLEVELREGARLLSGLAPRVDGQQRRDLLEAAALLDDAGRGLEKRLAQARSEALAAGADLPSAAAELSRSAVFPLYVDRLRAGFGSWYELFPRSQSEVPGQHGTFADVAQRLPDLAELGFDVVYLPPIHPIGETHRKGRNNSPLAEPGEPGSPWAIGGRAAGGAAGGHTALHPELGTLEDFAELVAAAKEHRLEIALDFALQCSPDHPWVREHPEWFQRRVDGSIRYAENPPKKYEDIYPLDFWCADREELWAACRDVLLFWIGHGVRIFRVDNPHTKPYAFWEWVIRDVQERCGHPDVIFFAEAFTRPKRMQSLAKLGFTQSYTYFTWKNTYWQLRDYLLELTQTEMAEYYRPNFFANTPDILHEYLQEGGRAAFRIRLLLAGTLSPSYGIYSGFELCENVAVRPGSEEYLHSEKYEIRQRDWHAEGNIREDVARLNRIRREKSCLQELANLELLVCSNEHIFAYAKHGGQPAPAGGTLLIVVTLDPHRGQDGLIELPLERLGLTDDEPFVVEDLMTGERFTWRGARNYVRLDPAQKVGHVFEVVR